MLYSRNVAISRLYFCLFSFVADGLYAYKVFGVLLEDCLPDLLADVYMDLAYRKQWDQYVKGE